ncbi:MAG: polyprenyl synthetase family protein [Polyangiaceae bacterium]
MGLSADARDAYLQACLGEAREFIAGLVPETDRAQPAYATLLAYPLRAAKGLRPALTVASCRALGGDRSAAGPTAAVLELLHNAFIVHDDVEDGSEMRRHEPTLPVQIGVPRAVHAGDTMLALALGPLLDNMRLLDMGRALRILDLVATMLRRTVEGQALELAWIADNRWDVTPAEYVEMVTLKTAWYTFVAPLACGAIAADAPAALIEELQAFGLDLGVAFQIRDDTLNLLASETVTGKERWGDLWEGKRTLVLAAFFSEASENEKRFARALLLRSRPTAAERDPARPLLEGAVRALVTSDALTAEQARLVVDAYAGERTRDGKTEADVAAFRSMLGPSIDVASRVAADFARRAAERWTSIRRAMVDSTHRDLIESILDYTIARDR